jgi:5-methylcytosine-specific restriction enzyme subunit McrC
MSDQSGTAAPSLLDLEVREHERLPGVLLEPAEVVVLVGLTQAKLEVRPSSGGIGHDLAAKQWVGTVILGGRTLRILPKVPMANLMFLLAGAGEREAWREDLAAHAESTDVLEAIASGFVRQTERALRLGLVEGYRPVEETSRVVRGRIAFARQLRVRPGVMIPIEVDRDVRDEDVLVNQVLRAAVDVLKRLPVRSRSVRDGLQRLAILLGRVTPRHFDAKSIPEVALTPSTERLRVPVELARVILRSASITHLRGRVVSGTFLVDMNAVFESFVRSTIRNALPPRVGMVIAPDEPPALHLDQQRSVRIRPDLRLMRGSTVVAVGDAKYKRASATGGLPNADLYQALAYAVATGLREAFLIYPRTEADDRIHQVIGAEVDVHVRCIDLAGSPARIMEDVRSISERLADAARSSIEIRTR